MSQTENTGKKPLAWLRKASSHVFIDGMAGMAMGLFATLIVGTILGQIASFIPGSVGAWLTQVANLAKGITGAGIGVGMAFKFKNSPLVTVSAGVAGMVGSFASNILHGADIIMGKPGEPLGGFVAALVAIEVGRLVSGKTKVDILVTPIVTILSGSVAGLLVGPPISDFMTWLGQIINWGAEQQPLLIGIIVSVLMGMILTLPISSAALGVSLKLSGIAAGAACIGCSAQMIGFAVASYRENKVGGLLAQGLGTSMLQIPNIFRKPVIWLPPILTSAILGPVSTVLLRMPNNAIGAGMGTSGLVGQIQGYMVMTADGMSPWMALLQLVCMHVLAPAVLTLLFSELMRRVGWIKAGDMALRL